ncbi:MAG: GTP-binding protein, partial [Candidatus Methanosuratincola petrocarbonis]
MSSQKKEHLNLLVMGHVDNGKSTLVGHLLFLAGGLDDRTLAALEEEAKKTGK